MLFVFLICVHLWVVTHAQSILSPQQRFVVVGDIWLSNRSQLLQRLGIDSVSSDSQIVAQLWEQCGIESLCLLEGMFALAIWDRERQDLGLVRDRTGSPTLYYTYSIHFGFEYPNELEFANLVTQHCQTQL